MIPKVIKDADFVESHVPLVHTDMKLKLKIPVATMKPDGSKDSNAEKFEVCRELEQRPKKPDGSKAMVVTDDQKFEVPTEHPQGVMKPESDSDSVKIIDLSPHFSPYKSHLARELSEELLHLEKQKKRSLAISKWNWDLVVDLGSSDDDDSESELSDTADSTKPCKKIPRVTIHSRNRVCKLLDESSED